MICYVDVGDARNGAGMSRSERSHFFWIAFTSLQRRSFRLGSKVQKGELTSLNLPPGPRL